MPWCEAVDGGVRLRMRVIPNAKHDALQTGGDDELRIRLNAPAVEGKANKALQVFLAKQLGVSKSSVQLLRGATSRRKQVFVSGISTATAHSALGF